MTFSIIIPTYNRAELLKLTLESLLEQETAALYEILVIDDGGTDHTAQVIQDLNADIIKYHWISNRERGAARNFGVSVAKGNYINFFDSDDIAYSNHLSLAYGLIQNNPSLDLFALSYDIKAPDNKLITKRILGPQVRDFILSGNDLSCNGVFIKRELSVANPFSEQRALSASEDYELWLRLAARYDFPCFPSISHAVIHHDQRSTLLIDAEKLIKRKQIMINEARSDIKVQEKFSKGLRTLEGSTYAYIALHLALTGKHKPDVLKYFFMSLNKAPGTLFSRRGLAIIKHGLLTW